MKIDELPHKVVKLSHEDAKSAKDTAMLILDLADDLSRVSMSNGDYFLDEVVALREIAEKIEKKAFLSLVKEKKGELASGLEQFLTSLKEDLI